MLRFIIKRIFFFDSNLKSANNCKKFAYSSFIKAKKSVFYERKEKKDEAKPEEFGLALPFFMSFLLLAKDKDDENSNKDINFNKDSNLIQKNPTRSQNFNFIADVVEEVMPSIVQIELKHNILFGFSGQSSGSGFIISEDGLILTNAHVVRDFNKELNVKLQGGKSFRGKVIKIDKSADLALIKIDCTKLKSVKLADSNKVRTGEFVVALGSPLTLSNTVTSGIVSNPSRDGNELGLNNELFYIQTDTIVTHGNSGGPLVNLDGEVIGINSMTATPGISFAIPSKYAKQFIESEKKTDTSRNYYLGIKMVTLTPQIHHLFSMQSGFDIRLPDHLSSGCLIIEVAPHSPAERAGLRRGDLIISANGVSIKKNSDLFKIVKQTPNLSLLIFRDGLEILAEVKAD